MMDLTTLGGVPPTMDGIVNNPLQKIQTTVPQAPEEVEQRKAGWTKLLEDPNAKAALFRMGLNMMQGTRQNESTIGAIGRNAIDAMDYYGAVTDLDRRRKQQEDRLALDTKNVNSQIASREVATAGQKQQNAQESAKFTEWQSEAETRKAKNKADVDSLISQNKLRDAQILKASFETEEAKRKADFIKANPELAATAMRAELLKPEAELNQTYAQTGSSEANMRRTDALMGIDAEELKLKQDEFNAKLDGRLPGGADDNSKYTGQAKNILQRYKNADKKRYPTLDDFIAAHYNESLGQSASGVYDEIERLQGTKVTVPSTTPGASPAQSPVITEQDIAETMRSSGRTRAEVIAAAKAKGYTLQGK